MTPFGLWTPREAISELIEMAQQERGQRFKVPRYKAILKHLEKAQFKGRPVADEPMSVAAIDAVIKEAWAAVQASPDPIKQMIEHMAAQGRA